MAEIKIKTPNGNNHVSLTTANASGDATVTLPKEKVALCPVKVVETLTVP